MFAAESRGEVPKGTAERWQKHTPKDKKLPERVGMKKSAFWTGFSKSAAEEVVEEAPEGGMDSSNEKKLKWNPNGGVDPRDPESMQVNEAVGMMTLPETVDGASCGTCLHFRTLDPVTGAGFCQNPQVKQDVTRRMLCSMWDAPDVYRASEAIDPASVAGAQMFNEAAGLEQQMGADPAAAQAAGGDPAAAQAAGADAAAAGADPAAAGQEAPAKKPAKPKPKEKESGSPTIHVNVGTDGAKGKEKTAFWAAFIGG